MTQLALPGTGRKRKRPAPANDPRLDALFADRDAWLLDGGQLAWRAERIRRRAALVARLRERRRNGYAATKTPAGSPPAGAPPAKE
jgi:hypothetical protein